MLWTSQTLELAIDHDSNPRAQCFAFFHAEMNFKLKRWNFSENNAMNVRIVFLRLRTRV